MNLLGKLFLQYSDGKSLRFGSKFSRFMGNTFLGKPENRGLDVLTSGQAEKCYLLTEDRRPPTDPHTLQEWEREGIFMAQFRNVEAAHSAVVVAVCGIALCFVLVGARAPLVAMSDTFDSATTTVAGWFDSAKTTVTGWFVGEEELARKAKAEALEAKLAMEKEWPAARCKEVLTKIVLGKPVAMPDDTVLAHCDDVLTNAQSQ